MNKKQYNSFQEIDTDLKILRLNKEIEKEKLKLTVQITKNNLYPMNLMGGFKGIIQKLVISVLAKKVLRRFS